MPVWLKAQNYRTGLVGKYLNGYGTNRTRSPKDDPTYIPPGWDDWQALVDPTVYRMYNYKINDNGKIVDYGADLAQPPKEYQTDVLAQRAKDFIRESSILSPSKPFFLWVTPFAPHSESRKVVPRCRGYGSIRPAPRHIGTASTVPLPMPLSFNEADISDKPIWFQNSHPPLKEADINCLRKTYRARLEALRAVDDLIGTVVQEIIQSEKLSKTMIIFTSDNGYLFGEHRAYSKQKIYEPSIRVPLYVRLPGKAIRQTRNQLVLNNDLAPTIAALAGAKPDILVDGRSFLRLLRNPKYPWRKQFLVENYGKSAFAAVRTADPILYASYTRGGKEYYNLTKDPEELNSLLDQSPPRLRELQTLLAKLQRCKG
ncbi:MAG: sulfatase-like hydrolase/transferase, partial [Thermosynechococcaceae cyanobacterium]